MTDAGKDEPRPAPAPKPETSPYQVQPIDIQEKSIEPAKRRHTHP